MKRMNIAEAYAAIWAFDPPRTCREMHAAGLFDQRPRALEFAFFEVYDAVTIAEGDAYVAESLVPGLVPIGGDRSGDRWCFDTRTRIGGTIPVAHCPHDGGGAVYVAPSFAAFMYRLVLENLVFGETFARRGTGPEALAALTLANLERVEPWLLRRWGKRGRALARGPGAPTHDAFEAFLRADPAFARLPTDAFDHFR